MALDPTLFTEDQYDEIQAMIDEAVSAATANMQGEIRELQNEIETLRQEMEE